MPIDFTDLERLRNYFDHKGGVLYAEGETEEHYRERCAVWSMDRGDAVQAMEVRSRKGWDRWNDKDKSDFINGGASMNSLELRGLRNVNVTRCKRWHPETSEPWTCADWSNALCGEAGELANVIKKIRRHMTGARNEGDPEIPELTAMAAEELADVVIYADLLADHLGIDLGEAIKKKFNKVSEKYGFPERIETT